MKKNKTFSAFFLLQFELNRYLCVWSLKALPRIVNVRKGIILQLWKGSFLQNFSISTFCCYGIFLSSGNFVKKKYFLWPEASFFLNEWKIYTQIKHQDFKKRIHMLGDFNGRIKPSQSSKKFNPGGT